MEIPEKVWKEYVKRLRRLDQTAADVMQRWMDRNPGADVQDLITVAYAAADKFGSASAALACEMYDALAEAQGAELPPAEPAETATFGETAKAVRGTMKNKRNSVPDTVGRLVKQAGADTIVQNARRDGAEWAWIPAGSETCAFCITLASRGWQRQSKRAAEGDHAEHIHPHCDCQYAVRFDGKSTVAGYDPEKYREMYENAEGVTPEEKINSMRRALYAENKDRFNEQKRIAYRNRREGLSGGVGSGIINTSKPVNTKLSDKSTVSNPMDRDDYFRIKRALEARGIEVFAATKGDDLRYMLFMGAEGTYSDGRITHIGEIPSRGTLLEEIIHMTQAQKYGELDSSDPIELCAREIEANRKLLKGKDAYRLDDMDAEDITRNLAWWEEHFEQLTGVSFDESNYRGTV